MRILHKGIILAGGSGTRLAPLTDCISKQLMPLYDKPMIYYPLSTLMLAGKRSFNYSFQKTFKFFQKAFSKWQSVGIKINYEIQEKPEGIAQAFLIAEKFLNGSPAILILGDNLFHGTNLIDHMKRA